MKDKPKKNESIVRDASVEYDISQLLKNGKAFLDL